MVIRVEDTTEHLTPSHDGHVRIVNDRDAQGRGNVRPRGEDVTRDAILFAPEHRFARRILACWHRWEKPRYECTARRV